MQSKYSNLCYNVIELLELKSVGNLNPIGKERKSYCDRMVTSMLYLSTSVCSSPKVLPNFYIIFEYRLCVRHQKCYQRDTPRPNEVRSS